MPAMPMSTRDRAGTWTVLRSARSAFAVGAVVQIRAEFGMVGIYVDQDRKLEGAITATDVLGEKPVQVVVARGIRRDEVQVRDIMTPRDRLQTLDMDQVRAAKVGHIVATLKQAARQHTLVTERDDKGNLRLRGIFSATQIARQLGVNIQTGAVANTFSEIEAQLVR